MTRGDAMLHRLRRGMKVSASVLIVTAHPDDETFGLGGALSSFKAARILQVTDGAVDDVAAWRGAGYETRDAYRAARSDERARAMLAGNWKHPIVDCALPDREVHAHLPLLIERVRLAIGDADVVFTHPYEGGHPDHDACAYAVQSVCLGQQAAGLAAPERFEFASYYWNGAHRVAGDFWPKGAGDVVRAQVVGERLVRKQAAIAEYRSQRNVARWFRPDTECYRPAQIYDFSSAPPTPGCLYERKGWPVSQAQWRAAVARTA